VTPNRQSDYTPSAVYKRLWGYTRNYGWIFALGLAGVSLDAAMQAVFIRFVEPLIDRVFVAKDAEYGLWLADGYPCCCSGAHYWLFLRKLRHGVDRQTGGG